MNKRLLSPLFLVAALAVSFGGLAVGGCKKAADLAKYKDMATGLADQYLPKLGDLGGKLDGLLSRAKALPASIPGAAEVGKLLTDNKGTIDQLKGLLASLPAKIAEKPAEAQKALDVAKQAVDDGISNVTSAVASAETKVGELEVQAKAADAAAAGPAADEAEFAMKLDSGYELKGSKNGVESALHAFINDSSKQVDKTTWFNFDRVTFQTGKADLDVDKSKDQLTNVAEILKAFPKVKLKVGGYTDNTGAADANKKISGQRAAAVVKALEEMGVAKDRLQSEGYGPDHPECPANDTEECKAKNRRIAVRVTAK